MQNCDELGGLLGRPRAQHPNVPFGHSSRNPVQHDVYGPQMAAVKRAAGAAKRTPKKGEFWLGLPRDHFLGS